MTRIKICGLRSPENALMVAAAGADMLGLNFYPETPRYVAPAAARDIAAALREALGSACPTLIGIFVNAPAADVKAIMRAVGLHYAQLSGDESAETVQALSPLAFKAIRPKTAAEAQRDAERFAPLAPASPLAPALLLDAYSPKFYGGTGELAGAEIAAAAKMAAPRLMLAGGLTPENVAERIAAIQPWAVDVASGVEAGQPGIKDEAKVRAFIAVARGNSHD